LLLPIFCVASSSDVQGEVAESFSRGDLHGQVLNPRGVLPDSCLLYRRSLLTAFSLGEGKMLHLPWIVLRFLWSEGHFPSCYYTADHEIVLYVIVLCGRVFRN